MIADFGRVVITETTNLLRWMLSYVPDGTKPLPEPMFTCHQWRKEDNITTGNTPCIINAVSKVRKNIYRSDVKVTFEFYGHLKCLLVLYYKLKYIY